MDEWAHLQRDFCDTHRSLIRDEITDQLVHGNTPSTPKLPNDFALLGQLPPLPDSPERLIRAILVCRQLISLKHSDSPQIAQWQDRLNEDWYELRELLRTRGELLKSAGNRLLFLRRCEVSYFTNDADAIVSIETTLKSELKRTLSRHPNLFMSLIC